MILPRNLHAPQSTPFLKPFLPIPTVFQSDTSKIALACADDATEG